MDKHTCKLCFRSFSNGRALGGHMRSHVASTAKAAAAAVKVPSPSPSLSSTPSSSHDDDEEEEEEEEEGIGIGIGYGLRENPRKSFRLVDPDFFPADGRGSSVVVQDRESETESSRAPPPIRSKRATPEPVSSVSDATPEETVAISLMMLSRDTWKLPEEGDGRMVIKKKMPRHHQQRPSVSVSVSMVSKGRSKYQCGTCKKVFRSYQALGGHRASHKKFKTCLPPPQPVIRIHDGESSASEEVRHQCPVCFRVFGSGQALGGHKRSHLTPPTSTVVASKFDLNMPAPMEEDAELSAVYDAHGTE